MNEDALDECAERLSAGRLRRAPMSPLPARLRPRDADEAYAVQGRLHERFAAAGLGAVRGWKVGCTTPVMQRYLGIGHPCAGGVLDASVRHAAGVFRHGDFVRVGVECEIAVALGADLPAAARPRDRAAVAAAVAAVMAAIEVVDDRWVDYREVDAQTLTADDFFGAGCVLGEPRADWHALDLAALRGAMTVNGEDVGEGEGRAILGHPLEALAWLAETLNARGSMLRAGEFVLLGSVVQTRWLAPGDRVDVRVDGLGHVRARFD